MTLNASIDPTFTISPSYALAGEFSIQYSANVLPEPTGLGLLGASILLLLPRKRKS